MADERRHFTGQQKLAILRAHLIEKTPVSEVCDKHGITPTQFYQWQKKLFEEGAAVFESPRGRRGRQEAGGRKMPTRKGSRPWRPSSARRTKSWASCCRSTSS